MISYGNGLSASESDDLSTDNRQLISQVFRDQCALHHAANSQLDAEETCLMCLER